MKYISLIGGIVVGVAAYFCIIYILPRFLAYYRAYKDEKDRKIDGEFKRHIYPKKND